MKRAVVLVIVALTTSTNCSNRRAAENNSPHADVTATPVSAPQSERPASEDLTKAPPEFGSVDFKNFSYPTNIRGTITLKDGEQIFNNPEGGGDRFRFVQVGYTDLTGDGKEEAIARLSVVSCGASCDGGSDLFYFYSSGKDEPRLLSRLETGSVSYGECGLKAFELNKRDLTLELFQICQNKGISFRSLPDPKNRGGKFEAQSYTRFRYVFNGDRFVVRRREVFPFPHGDVQNHEETVVFTN